MEEEQRSLEKIREYRRNYYQKNKKRIAEYQRKYYLRKKGFSPNHNLHWKGKRQNGMIIKHGNFVVSFD
jgi:hypothetical protein